MLEKIKGLSTKAKVALAAGLALLGAAGIGLGIWQPWKQQEAPPDEPDVRQEDPAPQPPAEEKSLSVRAGSEEVPCTLYEGDGWSIYVPEGWQTEKLGANGALFSSGDGAQLSVEFMPGSDYAGTFVNLSDGGGGSRLLQFYSGTGEGSPSVEGSAPQGQWTRYGKLFPALAKTLTVGTDKPFAESYVVPQEPDWQEAEGMTVLFLDKDGLVIDETVQDAVEAYMRTWPAENRSDYTGQYRVNRVEWASSYIGLTNEGYVDVFRADVQYRLTEDGAPEDVRIADGWAARPDSLYIALFHDGGSVSQTKWAASGLENGWEGFAAEIT